MSSNAAIEELKNPYLVKILKKAGIKAPGTKAFTREILPNAIKKLKEVINRKLNEAYVIILIVDIWSDFQMNDFIGLAAMMSNKYLDKECFVIGLEKMIGSHNAENIKKMIEMIVNTYDFDKSKIYGKFNLINDIIFKEIK